MKSMGGIRAGWIGAALLLVAACGGGAPEGDAAAPAPDDEAATLPVPTLPGAAADSGGDVLPEDAAYTGDTSDADTLGAQWTAGITDVRRPEAGMTMLNGVRAGLHEGFDRVVFQFEGDRLPGYHVEYVDRPVRQCGSGNPEEVAGDGWLSIRMEPSQAHDDQGRATAAPRERMPALPVVRELQSVCDFEGQVEWVLGVASPNRYRVLELREPARLVVDVRHD